MKRKQTDDQNAPVVPTPATNEQRRMFIKRSTQTCLAFGSGPLLLNSCSTNSGYSGSGTAPSGHSQNFYKSRFHYKDHPGDMSKIDVTPQYKYNNQGNPEKLGTLGFGPLGWEWVIEEDGVVEEWTSLETKTMNWTSSGLGISAQCNEYGGVNRISGQTLQAPPVDTTVAGPEGTPNF